MIRITSIHKIVDKNCRAIACVVYKQADCLRRYWYLCWADTSWLTIHLPPGRTCYYYGGTDTSAGRTQAYLWGDIMLGRRYAQLNDTHLLYLGWLVLLLTWAIHSPWLALHLRVIHIFLRLSGRYTTWLALHFIHWSFWAIHILFTDLKACLQISVHAFEKVYVTQGPLSSL